MLEGYGIKVTIAENGEEAMAVLKEEQFDGVLMDMQMPVMDGFSTTREIRKNPQYAELPIIALTANVMVSEQNADSGCGYERSHRQTDRSGSSGGDAWQNGCIRPEQPRRLRPHARPFQRRSTGFRCGGTSELAGRKGGSKRAPDRRECRLVLFAAGQVQDKPKAGCFQDSGSTGIERPENSRKTGAYPQGYCRHPGCGIPARSGRISGKQFQERIIRQH